MLKIIGPWCTFSLCGDVEFKVGDSRVRYCGFFVIFYWWLNDWSAGWLIGKSADLLKNTPQFVFIASVDLEFSDSIHFRIGKRKKFSLSTLILYFQNKKFKAKTSVPIMDYIFLYPFTVWPFVRKRYCKWIAAFDLLLYFGNRIIVLPYMVRTWR
jgi:hypothetical protein